MCAMTQNTSERQRSAELRRTPFGRTSQNAQNANFAEYPLSVIGRKRCLEIAPLPLLLKIALTLIAAAGPTNGGPSPGSLLYQPFEVAHHNRRSCYVSRPGSQLLDLARRVRHRR